MFVIYNCNDSTIIIYYRNDSGLYFKTMIVARQELKIRLQDHNLWALRNFPVRKNPERNKPETRKHPKHIHKSRNPETRD